MKSIEVKILNADSVKESERMAACAARLTQHGEKITNIEEFMALYNKDYTPGMIKNLATLPHPTLQKFGVINVVVVGASRRFLAQVTRHQNEVKFMSASLHYSDYSGQGDVCLPYELLGKPELEAAYYSMSAKAMQEYDNLITAGVDTNTAGYIMPQGLRNVLIISATPYQWKHMIGQRTCHRSATEIRYVMLKIWEQLYKLSPDLFGDAGPFCTYGPCKEGKMACATPFKPGITPSEILKAEFPLIYKEDIDED